MPSVGRRKGLFLYPQEWRAGQSHRSLEEWGWHQRMGSGTEEAALRIRRVRPSPEPWQLEPGSAPPSFPDVPASELHELLSRKLAQCGVMFDFLDCVADLKGKEVKRAALNELVECVGSTRGVLIEPVYPDIIRMVSPLPPGLWGAQGHCWTAAGGQGDRSCVRKPQYPPAWPPGPHVPSPLRPPVHPTSASWVTFAYALPRPGAHSPPPPPPQVPYCHDLAQVPLLP